MTDENLVGQTIAGKYRVEKLLGKGGMGIVVGARHLGLDEPVAIKILRPQMMEVAGMVARFVREAKAASKIKSHHVVRVTDVDTREDGVPYMVMEYLDGVDFSDLRKQRGTLGVTEAVGYVLEACDAIAEAHALGIVHRDLKPGNLFLHRKRDGKNVVKVLDFGISKVDSPGEQDTTKTGQMMGSPKYMSPEQMTSMHDVDGRSDIWSLGAILFELLCGRPPFVGDTTPRVCALVLNSDPPMPGALRPDLPPELEGILLRCLEKEPDRRFFDVEALAAALSPYAPSVDSSGSGASGASSGPRSSIGPRGSEPVSVTAPVASETPPASAVTSPAASAPATVGDTVTVFEGRAPRASRSRRVVAALAAAALLGGLGALYLTERRGAQPAALAPAATGTSGVETSAPVRAEPRTAAQPTQPSVSPSDLPDVTGAPTPPVSSGKPVGAAAAKKKAAPPVDPFGGRRN